MTTKYGIFDKDLRLLQDGFTSKALAEASAAFDYAGEDVSVEELCTICGQHPQPLSPSTVCIECQESSKKTSHDFRDYYPDPYGNDLMDETVDPYFEDYDCDDQFD